MKTNKYTRFQKILIVVVPIIVLLLIAAIVMCLAFTFLPIGGNAMFATGNLTIVMGLLSAILAIVAIVCSVFVKGGDDEEDKPVQINN